jgi:hypothetical protein
MSVSVKYGRDKLSFAIPDKVGSFSLSIHCFFNIQVTEYTIQCHPPGPGKPHRSTLRWLQAHPQGRSHKGQQRPNLCISHSPRLSPPTHTNVSSQRNPASSPQPDYSRRKGSSVHHPSRTRICQIQTRPRSWRSPLSHLALPKREDTGTRQEGVPPTGRTPSAVPPSPRWNRSRS